MPNDNSVPKRPGDASRADPFEASIAPIGISGYNDNDPTEPRGHRAIPDILVVPPRDRAPGAMSGDARAAQTPPTSGPSNRPPAPSNDLDDELEDELEDDLEDEADLDAFVDRALQSDATGAPRARPSLGIIGADVAMNLPPDGHAGEPVPMTMPRASALGEDVQHPWGQTWFSLMQQRWTSIVLVPAEPGINTVDAAKALAEVGGQYQFEPIQVIDAGDVGSGSLQGVLDTMQVFDGSEARLLIAISSPLTHDAAIPSARSADGAVLVLRMGRTRIADAQRTIAAIGASHFIGAIALRD